MKRKICFLLILVMLFSALSGCGEKKKLLGAWHCTLDASQLAQQFLEDQNLGGDYEIPSFAVTAMLTFSKDNTFRLELDTNKLTEAMSALESTLAGNLADILQEQLSERGLGVDIGQLLDKSGLESDALTQQLTQNFYETAFTEMLNGVLALEGYYQVKGDKLLFTNDPDSKLDEVYITYGLEGGTLTLEALTGTNTFVGDNLFLGAAGVAFTK